MSVENAALSLVILTEDSGQDGHATVEGLVRSMLQLIAPGCGSHRIQFVPGDAREAEAMRGNVWKTDGKNPRDYNRCVRLLRYLARQLSLSNTFVLFHIDGDRPWRDRETSENVAKFERLIRARLPQAADQGRAHRPKGRGQASVEAPPLRLEHLLLLCPFRSIEAWLYQNLHAAKAICTRDHRGAHVDDLQSWDVRRDELDELSAPETTSCLGKAFNLELTRGFPAQAAYNVQKSFAESVDRLKSCEALVDALETTRSTAWPSSSQ